MLTINFRSTVTLTSRVIYFPTLFHTRACRLCLCMWQREGNGWHMIRGLQWDYVHLLWDAMVWHKWMQCVWWHGGAWLCIPPASPVKMGVELIFFHKRKERKCSPCQNFWVLVTTPLLLSNMKSLSLKSVFLIPWLLGNLKNFLCTIWWEVEMCSSDLQCTLYTHYIID